MQGSENGRVVTIASINDFYQVLVHLAKRFQRRRFFRNQPIRNKNCLWRPCLLMDRDEVSTPYRGPSIDASYQVLVHLAKVYQRRRLKCEKLTTTDDRRRTPSDDKSSHCLWQGELTISLSLKTFLLLPYPSIYLKIGKQLHFFFIISCKYINKNHKSRIECQQNNIVLQPDT